METFHDTHPSRSFPRLLCGLYPLQVFPSHLLGILQMSRVLFETVYNGDRHVFLDDGVISFEGTKSLSNPESDYADFEKLDHGGYYTTTYKVWFKMEVGNYTLRDASELKL